VGFLDNIKRGFTSTDGSFTIVSLMDFEKDMWNIISAQKGPSAELHNCRTFIEFFYTSVYVKHNASLNLIDDCFKFSDSLFAENKSAADAAADPLRLKNLVREKVFGLMLEHGWDLDIPYDQAIEDLQVTLQSEVGDELFESFLIARNSFFDQSDAYFSGVKEKYYSSFVDNTTWGSVFTYLGQPYYKDD